jgi:hypothetical protein
MAMKHIFKICYQKYSYYDNVFHIAMNDNIKASVSVSA